MKFKRIIFMAICMMLLFNGITVFAKPMAGSIDGKALSLGRVSIDQTLTKVKIEPKEEAENITGVTIDSIFKLQRSGFQGVNFSSQPSYCVKEGELYIKTLKNKHTITVHTKAGDYHFIFKGDSKNGIFERIDFAHKPNKKIHVKLEGYFESALKGQKKYDGISGATGSAKANENSNIKVMVAETEPNVLPKNEDWIELGKSNIETDKGKTKIILAKESGMTPMYNSNSSSVTLSGTPENPSNYQVSIKLVDIYGREAESKPAWFSVVDIENVFLDKVFEDVNNRLKVTNNVLFTQDPWYIAHFNQKKPEEGKNEQFIVPKNVHLWQGSKESGVYGVLGKILPATNKEPDRAKGEYHKWEDKIPTQDFILKEGTNLTMAYMKVLSGVNIIVEKGAVLNLYDSSIFGKITVDGGTLRVNYDTEGKFTGDIEAKNPNKLISGTSIQGQIILKNGAVLEDSYVYSHTNNLVDGGAALENIRPVVLVQGKAFIKGNVFVRGDESPTGEDKQTKKVYRGQNAMAIENGSLTIADKSSLYLYGGGTNVTTSLGGNALELKDGKVLGEGTLVAMGGVGHDPIKDENIAGYAVVGRGDISCEKVYLRSGNAYAGSEEQRAIKSNDGIKIHKNVKGKIIDSKGGDGEYREYWKRSSIPYKVDSLIPNEILRPDGDEKISGEAVPADIFKPGKKIKRVDLKSSNVYQKSIAVTLNDEGRAWLEEIKNKQAKVKVNNQELTEVSDNARGYRVDANQFYATGLKIGEEVIIEVEGFAPVLLRATAVDVFNEYNLQVVDRKDNLDDTPVIIPEVDITDEDVNAAKVVVKNIVDSIALEKLELKGVNITRNTDSINKFKEAVKEAKELANAKNQLSKAEREKLVNFGTEENGRYKGFDEIVKYIKPELAIEGIKEVRNKHDNTKLHVKLSGGKVKFKTLLENVTKEGESSLVVYRIDKNEYEAKIDTLAGATPKFEKNLLENKYYDIENLKDEYVISFNENELMSDYPNTELLKVVFRVKLYDGIYAENSDFVFLNNKNKVKPSPKPTPAPEDPKDVDSVTGQKLRVEKDITLRGHVEYENETTGQRETGHYEYRKLVRNGEGKVYKTEKTKIEEGYIEGYPDGSFKPENSITRAEAATMMMKMQGNKVSSSLRTGFSDAEDSWYNQALNYAVNNNMLLADGNKIRPNDAITRAEFARLVMPVLRDNEQRAPFVDIKGDKFEKAIDIAYSNGIIIGYPDGSFKPENSITRAEAVTMMNRISKKYLSLAELNSNASKLKSFSDVLKNHWAYREIMSAINYNMLNTRTEVVYGYEPTTYETLERVWVVDRPEKSTVRREVAYENRTLEDSDKKIKVLGNIQKTAELKLADKVISDNGESVIVIPQSVYQWLKSEPVNKYEILKSYQAYLTGGHKNKLEAVFEVGQNYEGKILKVLHIVDGKLVESDVEVKDGKVSLNVDELNSFVILTEAKQQPKEKTEVEKVQEKIGNIGKVDEYSGEKIKEAFTAYGVLSEADKKAVSADKLFKSIKEFSRLSQNKGVTVKEGQGQVIDKKTDNLQPIVSTAENKDFICVMMDENIVDEKDYTRTEGSTKIEFKKDYIDELQKGQHDVLIVSSSGTAKTILKIEDKDKEKKKEEELNKDKEKKKEEKEKKDKSELKKVKFEGKDLLGKFPTKGIKVNLADSDSRTWIENIENGKSSIKKLGKEDIKKKIKSTEEGYQVSEGILTISGLKEKDTVTIEVEGYETITLEAKNDSWGIYYLTQVENTKKSEEDKKSEEELNKDKEKKKEEKEKKDKSELKKVKFEGKDLLGKFPTKGIKVNLADSDSRTWIENIENGKSSIKKLGKEDIKKKIKSTEEGYQVSEGTLTISGLKEKDTVTIEVEGYETITLEAKNDSWGIYHLTQVENSKRSVVEDTVVELEEGRPTEAEQDSSKVVTFEKPNMFSGQTLRTTRSEINSLWLKAIDDEVANLRTLQGNVILKNNPVKKVEGYKVDVHDYSLNIYGLDEKQRIIISVKGYKDVVLEVQKDNWGSKKLVVIEDAVLEEDSRESKPSVERQKESSNLKDVPKIGIPANKATNTLNSVSNDPNTEKWYEALKQSGIIKGKGGEVLKRYNTLSMDGRGYNISETAIRIKFNGLEEGETISIEVEGWPTFKAKVIKLIKYGQHSQGEAEFEIIKKK